MPTRHCMQPKRAGDVAVNLGLKKQKLDCEVVKVGVEEAMAATDKPPVVEIDEDLHSRQLAVYGRETMRRMFGSSVLISGLKGLGVEVAKNVILAGVKSVALHDSGVVGIADLSAHFYLSEADIGKNRAEACADRLAELNKAVAVRVVTEEITQELLGHYQAAVFTDLPLDKAIAYDKYCRSHSPPVAFIKADIRGVFGSVFCDFGPSFKVIDTDGEDPFAGIVASVSNDNPALVTCVDDERLHFEDGDLVTFSEVRGMEHLNDGKPRKVKTTKAHSFTLEEDTREYGAYSGGGIVTQVKPPKLLDFKSLEEALQEPGEFLLSDFGKFDRPPLLHLAFQALDKFRAEYGRLPGPGSVADSDKVVALVKALNDAAGDKKVETLDEGILRRFAHGASAELNPMAAMFGGVVGQEVQKACSGKFHPLFQFFYFDSVESLSAEPLPEAEVAPSGERYDEQVAVFGKSVQEKLANAKVFLVGSGALGCEFLKNFALMGVATGPNGMLTVTDDDTIEKSNLSRQFLFRDRDIGQAKSGVAARAAKAINPAIKIRDLQNRVGPETEEVFNDSFWGELTVVVNALDNVNARLYVDSRAVYFQKPLLESGTLGPKCNTQAVIPMQTENYGASRDPPERQAPMCTVHSFPHNIDHCLTWARSEFEGLLEKTPTEANVYLEKPGEYAKQARQASDPQAREALERVVECLVTERCRTFEDCVEWARNRFEDYFANRVKQLTFTFPEDAATSTGVPFWSAPKRFPRAVVFDAHDPSHLSFLQSLAILRAETFGITLPPAATDLKQLEAMVSKVAVPEFSPKQGVKIVTDEKATSVNTSMGDDEALIEQLLEKLDLGSKELSSGFRMAPVTFEKDDDTNFHMDLIAGLANMRARNYAIPEVDKLKAKFIAGRIIPAIATTTALATGLVCLELYKVIQGHAADKHRNTFANLALPLFSMAEPVPPKSFKHNEETWSIWDRWIVEGDVTLRELLKWFSDKKLNAYSISCGQSLLYNNIFPNHKQRLDKKVSDLARDIAKINIPDYRRHFDIVVACEDENDEDMDVPLISIRFR
eukprot:TRINITY_DN38822_c0_g1_i1.p1 TRINITY_DN38822_c0_g1~~TRINITY_DN38822_c0_g1_i1.p1  ORF type:complete len:1057 (+),score=227.94 TRINITY_DN38822_c0_g1_i1:231-3401(+)